MDELYFGNLYEERQKMYAFFYRPAAPQPPLISLRSYMRHMMVELGDLKFSTLGQGSVKTENCIGIWQEDTRLFRKLITSVGWLYQEPGKYLLSSVPGTLR